MEKQQLIDYILNSPENTNPAILNQMIDEIGGGGSGDISNEKTYPVIFLDFPGDVVNVKYYNTNDAIVFPSLPRDDYDYWYLDPNHGSYYPNSTLNISDIISNYPTGVFFYGEKNNGDMLTK